MEEPYHLWTVFLGAQSGSYYYPLNLFLVLPSFLQGLPKKLLCETQPQHLSIPIICSFHECTLKQEMHSLIWFLSVLLLHILHWLLESIDIEKQFCKSWLAAHIKEVMNGIGKCTIKYVC
jgi:hypothetical protein